MQKKLEKLAKHEELLKKSKYQRLLAHPIKGLFWQIFIKCVHPIFKKDLVVTVRTFWGKPIVVILPLSFEYYMYGMRTDESDIRLTKYLIKSLKWADIFFDIGAHYGFYSLLAASSVGEKGRVHAFEASPVTFKLLKRNVEKEDTVVIKNCIVSDTSGVKDFYNFLPTYSESNTTKPELFASEEWFQRARPDIVKIEATSIDDYCKENGTVPSLVKVDVEGAECDVISGMRQILKEHAPVIVMEYFTEIHFNNSNHKKAAELMISLGYAPFVINDDGDLLRMNAYDEYFIKRGCYFDNLVFKKEISL